MRRWHWLGATIIALAAALPIALLATDAAGPPDGRGRPAGPPASIQLTPDPLRIACDGVDASTLTVRLTDASGKPVADGTDVFFEVQYGFASPVEAQTVRGEASTEVRLYDFAAQFPDETQVTVYAGDLRASINIGCIDGGGGGGCEFSPLQPPLSPPCPTPSPPSPPPCGPAFSPPCETPTPCAPTSPPCATGTPVLGECIDVSQAGAQHELYAEAEEDSGVVTLRVGAFPLSDAPSYQAIQWGICYDGNVLLVLSVERAAGAPVDCMSSLVVPRFVYLGCINFEGDLLRLNGDAWIVKFTCLGTQTLDFGLRAAPVASGGFLSKIIMSGNVEPPIRTEGSSTACSAVGPPTYTPTPTVTRTPAMTPTPGTPGHHPFEIPGSVTWIPRGSLDIDTPTPTPRGRGDAR